LRGRDQIAWLRRLDAEHNNLRAALSRAGELGDSELGARLCSALTHFWQSRGYLAEGRAWIAAVLESEPVGGLSALLRSRLLLRAGQLALWLELAESIELLTEAVAIARAQGAQEMLAESLIWLGTAFRRQFAFTPARRAIEEGMALARSSGNTACLALAEVMLGLTLINESDNTRAVPWLAQALDHFLIVGDARWIATTRVLYGGCLLESGSDPADAGRMLRAGLLELHEVGELPLMITGLYSLALLAAMNREPIRAVRLVGAADALSDSLGAAWTPVVAGMESSVLSHIGAHVDEPTIAAARMEGRRLSLEDALAGADTVGV
jgi:non-specific serine/threonine protein kinase